MKKLYALKNNNARKSVDLQDYKTIITEAYALCCPQVKVDVYPNHYIIDGNATNAQLRKAGHYIAKSKLGEHAITYKYKGGISTQLFYGKTIQ